MPPKEGREAIDVLLVEDDEQVRKFIARLLTNAGYRIEEAANEQEALSAASRTEFGVVVTDLGLPGIGGAALIERLAESHEATTFVIVTGALDEGLPSSPLLDRAIVAVLTKPFDRDELARVVARASDIHEARRMGDQAGRGGLQVPKCVLIVEHNPDDAELLKRSLSDLYDPTPKILVAGRVEEAEELLGQAEIDLVLSDLGFSDARGLDAVRRLQRVAPGTPLIVLTGLDDDEIENHAVQLGAQDYLIKGAFSPTSLKRVIRHSMERKQAEKELTRLAQTDHLTGLSNRLVFRERATQALARARRRKVGVALLYLDLNGFKDVNDKLGHEAGDAVLREVAERLENAIREVDVAARIGGDEFAVLLEEIGTEEHALQATQRIPEILKLPLSSAQGLPVSFSIGMALHPTHGDSVAELLAAADRAMYSAKRTGTGLIAVGSPIASEAEV